LIGPSRSRSLPGLGENEVGRIERVRRERLMMPDADQSPLFCDRCSAVLRAGRGSFYVVKVEAVADPTPPAFTEGHLNRDVGREIDHLIHRLRDMTERELMDQVHRRLVLYLCTSCYRTWIENPTGT
jgi:hypothetical protein